MSVPSAGKIVVVDGAGSVRDLVRGLARPHDMVFHTIGSLTYLYVAEKNQIRRYLWQSGAPTNSQIVVANLPDASLSELRGSYGHELKNIALDGENRLFVSIASATNADPADLAATPKRGAIYVYDADGRAGRLYAQGIRNTEGLAIAPGTNDLWVVVNNRDNIAYPFITTMQAMEATTMARSFSPTSTIIRPKHSSACATAETTAGPSAIRTRTTGS